MGKITYRPKGHNKNLDNFNLKNSDHNYKMDQVERRLSEESDLPEFEQAVTVSHKKCILDISNMKPIGDLECDYHIYLEDYVYTYLYQYALADLSIESSAVLLGQYYAENKEIIVRGIIPIPMDQLGGENEWIDEAVLKEVEQERAEYFKNEKIIGWMHMQPGYGTMLTMKELREHKKVFGEIDSIFMLVDAVNKIETLFVYENEELKEQTGYYMYYERNEEMQKYMLDHPFVKKEAQVIEDSVVNQFREIGKLRKNEYMQRKNVNATVIIASIILIALTAVIVKMNDTKNDKSVMSGQVSNVASGLLPSLENQNGQEETIQFIIQESQQSAESNLEISNDRGELPMTAVGETIEEETTSQAPISNELEIKEESEPQNISKQEQNKEVQAAEKNIKQYEEYIVKEGDTLADISYNKYGSARMSKDIARFNEIGNTDYIRVGQMLKLPID